MFLFGSDLQWRLNGFEDRVRTPLERLARLSCSGERHARRRLASQHWSPVLYRRVNCATRRRASASSPPPSRGTATRMVVSLGVLPRERPSVRRGSDAAGPRGVVGRVADEQVLETHAAPIYLYKLTA